MSKKKPSPCLLCDCACGVTCNCAQCTCTNGPCAASSAVRVAAYVIPMPRTTDTITTSTTSTEIPFDTAPIKEYLDASIEEEGLTWAVSMVDLDFIYSPVIPNQFAPHCTPDVYEVDKGARGQYWLRGKYDTRKVDAESLKVMRARYIIWKQQQVMGKPEVRAEIDRVMQIMGSMDGAYMPLTPDATGLRPLIIPMGKSEEEEAVI